MKKLQYSFIVLFFVALAFSNFNYAQDNLSFELSCNIHKVLPYISIEKEQLTKAETLSDINRHYKSSWVKEYLSVEISAIHDGKTKKASNKSYDLSQEQKNLMSQADAGTKISVNVRYIPNNTLIHNDPKEIDFSFIPHPENEAVYTGGQKQLDLYLKKNILDKIPSSTFKQYQLTAVKFTINTEGEITNAHVFESSRDEKVDDILLKTIQNMPCWKSAEYANGQKEEQEFVLAIGDMTSCIVNLLNIRELL